MIFNLCAYWNETRGTVIKKKPNLLQYAIQLVCILKWNKMDRFQKNPIDDNMLLNSCAKWNKRGSFPKTTIYYCMIFNLCAYWNETRDAVLKKIQLMTICYWTRVRNETRGAVFKKQHFITVCYSTCVSIEMKQEGQLSKKKKKNPIYYSMLFNLCAYWNETRWTDFKKIQLMTICYWTHVRNETRGAVFQKNNNLLLYDIQLVCVLKWNKRCSSQKNPIDDNMLLNSCCEMKQEGQLTKNNILLLYAIQLVCVLKWNKRW